MRSTYSSGFGISVPSFMASNKGTRLVSESQPLKKNKYKKKMSLKVLNPRGSTRYQKKEDISTTKNDMSLVVYEDVEQSSKDSRTKSHRLTKSSKISNRKSPELQVELGSLDSDRPVSFQSSN